MEQSPNKKHICEFLQVSTLLVYCTDTKERGREHLVLINMIFAGTIHLGTDKKKERQNSGGNKKGGGKCQYC